jgi:hypothetical protein
MAYQSRDGAWCQGHLCNVKLRRGEGQYVSYPRPMALCDLHFNEWKENNKTGREFAKLKRQQKPTLFD